MNPEVMIKTENLTKTFGMGSNQFTAVNSINIEVKKGEIHGFLGPNGAGKTTTIKMLIGAIRPTKGEALIKGMNIGCIEAKQTIGYSPERPSFYENMEALDYLEFIGMICGMTKHDAREKGKELLNWLELKDATYRQIRGFSAGMKQRLSLAQALIHDPQLLILDEPTANLDPIGRLSLIEKIKQLAKEKEVTIFVSSHILPEIEKMADYVTIIDHGKIILETDMKSLKHHFEGNHYVLDCSNNKKIIEILKRNKYITKVWIDEEAKINFTVTEESKIRKEIPRLIYQNNLELINFGRLSLSLEKIFMEVIEEGKNDKT